jgi:DNA-binding beta-propeller fold protein YncE
MEVLMLHRWSSGLLISTAWIGLAACGAGDYANSSSPPRADAAVAQRQCYGANDCAPGLACNEFGYCVPLQKADAGVAPKQDGQTLPPEVEVKTEPPATGKKFVYVAVPDQDMVARIDSVTLQVRAIKVGGSPGALRTLPDQDVGLVLNRLSGTASLLRARPDGGDDVITLKTVKGANQLALAPDGKHAVAYTDLTLAGGIPGSQSLQEVTLLRLIEGKEQAIDLPVGFRPSGVQFTADSSRAFVITESAISILELLAITKPVIPVSLPTLKDPLKEAHPSDVQITPDGSLALVRQPGVKGIRAVDLASKAITDLALPAEPTDLDLAPAGGLAVVVLRDASQVALIQLPAGLTDPAGLELLSTAGYVAGQAEITADSKRAYLFSNATTQQVVLVADLVAGSLDVLPLKKGVRAVRPAPDGLTALVVHNKAPGSPTPQEGVQGIIDKSWGYSLISLASGFVKLQLSDADPGPSAFAPDGTSAYLLLSDLSKGVRQIDAIDLLSFLVQGVTVGSPPVALGVVPATSRVFVAQSHALGRVTFIDMATLALKTVTGFELNSYVIE